MSTLYLVPFAFPDQTPKIIYLKLEKPKALDKKLKLKGQELEKKNCVKYLGVHFVNRHL